MTAPTADGVGGFLDPVDLEQVAATDAMLDQIAHRTPPAGDRLASNLARWLDRIDAEHHFDQVPLTPSVTRALDRASAAADSVAPKLAVTIAGPGRRRRRLAVAVAGASVVALAGTSVAAASPGSILYPVRQAMFGETTPVQSALNAASQALDQAETIIVAGARRHAISASDAVKARGLLGRAADLIEPAPTSALRSELLLRRQDLAGALGRLTIGVSLPTTNPQTLRPSAEPTDPGQSEGPDGGASGIGDHSDPTGESDTGDEGNSGPESDGSTSSTSDQGQPTSEASNPDTSGTGGDSPGDTPAPESG